jgi:hypothetical protein
MYDGDNGDESYFVVTTGIVGCRDGRSCDREHMMDDTENSER